MVKVSDLGKHNLLFHKFNSNILNIHFFHHFIHIQLRSGSPNFAAKINCHVQCVPKYMLHIQPYCLSHYGTDINIIFMARWHWYLNVLHGIKIGDLCRFDVINDFLIL